MASVSVGVAEGIVFAIGGNTITTTQIPKWMRLCSLCRGFHPVHDNVVQIRWVFQPLEGHAHPSAGPAAQRNLTPLGVCLYGSRVCLLA